MRRCADFSHSAHITMAQDAQIDANTLATGNRRWTTGVLGTVVLGIVGSALWDLALRPAFYSTRNALLNLTSFGIESARNSAYVEAARGFHEHAANAWLNMFSGLEMGAAIITLFVAFAPLDMLRKRILGAENGDDLDARVHRTRRVIQILAVILLVLFGWLTGEQLRNSYAITAAGHFEQLDAVIAPFSSTQQRAIWRSEFAQVTTRDDYVAITTQMEVVARQHSLRVPEFEPW